MPDETIEVRYRSVLGSPIYHKYIVYTDSSGNVYYARGGPAAGDDYADRHPGTSEGSSLLRPLGDIVTEYGLFVDSPLNPDWDPDNDDPRETLKIGADLSADFQAVLDAMDTISGADYPYKLSDWNCNTVVDTALSTAGLNEPTQDDIEENFAPGSGHSLPPTPPGEPGDPGFPDINWPVPPWWPTSLGDLWNPIKDFVSPLVLDLDGSNSIDLIRWMIHLPFLISMRTVWLSAWAGSVHKTGFLPWISMRMAASTM